MANLQLAEGPFLFSLTKEWALAHLAIPPLVKYCHDFVDHCTDSALEIANQLEKITTLFSMLVKRYEFTRFIFVDHYSSVASPTGS
jgi:hypothetical protein